MSSLMKPLKFLISFRSWPRECFCPLAEERKIGKFHSGKTFPELFSRFFCFLWNNLFFQMFDPISTGLLLSRTIALLCTFLWGIFMCTEDQFAKKKTHQANVGMKKSEFWVIHKVRRIHYKLWTIWQRLAILEIRLFSCDDSVLIHQKIISN